MSEHETTTMTCSGTGCEVKFVATPGRRGYCQACQEKYFPKLDAATIAARKSKSLEAKTALKRTRIDPTVPRGKKKA